MGTWTFMGHWNDAGELELDYHVPGDVEDTRVGSGPLFASAGTAGTPEEAWTAIRNEYEAGG